MLANTASGLRKFGSRSADRCALSLISQTAQKDRPELPYSLHYAAFSAC